MTKLFLLLATTIMVLPTHDFHVSKTTVRYVAEREQVQIEMHIFLDDLELALSEAGSPKLYIGTDKEMPQTATHIARYLEKNFRINWNGTPLPIGLLGFELSDDLQALWIYAQAKTRAPLESIEIENAFLTEIYDDQKNMVKIEAGSKRTTLLLSRDRTVGDHTF
ncbi:MAG: DUF6702 family protein [Bacteroidota bacterium]